MDNKYPDTDVLFRDVRDLTEKSVKPQFVAVPDDQDSILVKDHNGAVWTYRIIDLKGQRLAPRAIKEKVYFDDRHSFCDYLDFFKKDTSRIFFDMDQNQFVAVIDYTDNAEPTWGDHQATLKLRYSEEFKMWQNICTSGDMAQREFGRFLEDNRDDVIEPIGSDLLAMIMTFEATKNVDFKEASRNDNGQVQLVWEEKIEQKLKGISSVMIPPRVAIQIPVFLNEEPERIELFLRYNLNEGERRVKFKFEMCQPSRVCLRAAQKIVSAVAHDTTLSVHFGKRQNPRG